MKYKEDLGLKANKGGLRQKKVTVKEVTIFPNENRNRCPVAIMSKYNCKIPKDCKSNALYLRPKKNFSANGSSYCDASIGINMFRQQLRNCVLKLGWKENIPTILSEVQVPPICIQLVWMNKQFVK